MDESPADTHAITRAMHTNAAPMQHRRNSSESRSDFSRHTTIIGGAAAAVSTASDDEELVGAEVEADDEDNNSDGVDSDADSNDDTTHHGWFGRASMPPLQAKLFDSYSQWRRSFKSKEIQEMYTEWRDAYVSRMDSVIMMTLMLYSILLYSATSSSSSSSSPSSVSSSSSSYWSMVVQSLSLASWLRTTGMLSSNMHGSCIATPSGSSSPDVTPGHRSMCVQRPILHWAAMTTSTSTFGSSAMSAAISIVDFCHVFSVLGAILLTMFRSTLVESKKCTLKTSLFLRKCIVTCVYLCFVARQAWDMVALAEPFSFRSLGSVLWIMGLGMALGVDQRLQIGVLSCVSGLLVWLEVNSSVCNGYSSFLPRCSWMYVVGMGVGCYFIAPCLALYMLEEEMRKSFCCSSSGILCAYTMHFD